jgi:hypothetical protein
MKNIALKLTSPESFDKAFDDQRKTLEEAEAALKIGTLSNPDGSRPSSVTLPNLIK